LVGLDVVTTAGEAVGTVSEVLHLPAQDVLSVTSGDREILVPFVSAVVPQVDIDARRIVIDPPPGLLDADL
jgi:16S rRNA processing protein RimM